MRCSANCRPRTASAQLEAITRLPITTDADEEAWYGATRAPLERLETRFPDIASVVPHQLYHYFDDADTYRSEPSFRATWERYACPKRPNQAVQRTADFPYAWL